MAPLISQRMRLPAIAATTTAWGVAVVVGMLVADQQHAGPTDRTLIEWVHASIGDGGGLAAFLLVPTDTDTIACAVAVVAAVALVRRRWDVVVLAVATPTAGVAITELALKPLFGRTLHGQLSYPSGHAVATVAIYTVALLAFASGTSGLRRALASLGWVVMATAIMAGLVGMNCHYPTDTVGGVCVAVGVVLPGALLAGTVRRRTRPRLRIPVQRTDSGLDREPVVATRSPDPG